MMLEGVMSWLILIGGLAFLFWLCSKLPPSTKSQIGLQDVVSIARHQGWVNPYRLNAQKGFSRLDGQRFLNLARRQGLLRQEVNGRWYVDPINERLADALLSRGWKGLQAAKKQDVLPLVEYEGGRTNGTPAFDKFRSTQPPPTFGKRM